MTDHLLVCFFAILCFGKVCCSVITAGDGDHDGFTEGYDIGSNIIDLSGECILPDIPLNGRYKILGDESTVTAGSPALNGTIIQYVCDPGYDPVIDSNAICRNGEWITDFFKCHKNKKCLLPNVPENGGYNVSKLEGFLNPGGEVPNWSLLTFYCEKSHDLIGNNISLCHDGVWSTQVPICERNKRCSIPKLIDHGKLEILGSEDTPVNGSVVEEMTAIVISCQEGYSIVGNELNVCFEGAWFGEGAVCKENQFCLLPEFPAHGSYIVVGSEEVVKVNQTVAELTILDFLCDDGYILDGTNILYCNNTSWSSEPPVCEKEKRCELPSKPGNGSYVILGPEDSAVDQTVVEQTILEFSCETNHKLKGDKQIVCEDTRWSSEPPLCLKQAEVVAECSDVDNEVSGEYVIKPSGIDAAFTAYCEMEVAFSKWTVIQRRFNGSFDFHRDFQTYTDGFGQVSGEFWIGLERLHQLTKDNQHELYIEITPFEGSKKFARFSEFNIGSKDEGYKLHVQGYSGDAGDSLSRHNGKKFNSYDMKQDDWNGNCIDEYRTGWWFGRCEYSNLNAKYYSVSTKDYTSMHWETAFKQWSLKESRMMIAKRKSGALQPIPI